MRRTNFLDFVLKLPVNQSTTCILHIRRFLNFRPPKEINIIVIANELCQIFNSKQILLKFIVFLSALPLTNTRKFFVNEQLAMQKNNSCPVAAQ